MRKRDKPLVWLHGEVKTPPFSTDARIEAGVLLRRLQRGENISLPHSRPMPSIGNACHELRIQDERKTDEQGKTAETSGGKLEGWRRKGLPEAE